jgi:hypothetical protein
MTVQQSVRETEQLLAGQELEQCLHLYAVLNSIA